METFLATLFLHFIKFYPGFFTRLLMNRFLIKFIYDISRPDTPVVSCNSAVVGTDP